MSDLISRETAVAILRAKADMVIGEVKDAASFFNGCANMIEKLPAVDAEPVRHGKWMTASGMLPPEHHGRKYCSACAKFALNDFFGRERLSLYCPFCGAKMDGGER